MLPEYACFICRTCNTPFYFGGKNFKAISEANNIICPRCHKAEDRAHRQWVQKFFIFYPRLIKGIETLRQEGIAFTFYEFIPWPETEMYWISKLWFKCTRCGHDLVVNALKDAIKEPPLFACSACGHRRVKKKTAKDFLVSLSNVNLSAWHIMHHQWNIFAPLRLNSNDYLKHWKRRLPKRPSE